MKTWQIASVALGGVVVVALIYFLTRKPSLTVSLTITNPQASYSISQNERVLATLTTTGTPTFTLQYWIDGSLFATNPGFISNTSNFGFLAGDAGFGLLAGSHSIYFVVTDANGNVGTSNTITFTVVP